FVQASHARLDVGETDQDRAFERKSQHFEVGYGESAADLGGVSGAGAGLQQICAAQCKVAVEEGEPAVLGVLGWGLGQGACAGEPAGGDGRGATKVEVVAGEPGGAAGRAYLI